MIPYLREKLPDFRAAFLTITHSTFNPGYRQRFVLGQMENTLRKMAGMIPHGHGFIQSLQIEHILPQTPRDNKTSNEFQDMEAYQSAVVRLGNVTLLESMINQAVNNFNDLNSYWFANKQKEYVKSDVVMSNLLNPDYQIGQNTGLNRVREELGYKFTEWGLVDIERRQKIMMELAFETWRLCGERLDTKVE
ncbi:MAG: HNH endonuclease family protein [Desulfovermiculus sp.]|nr:HNH endonuclease family protein [Desulfovermiculus sp.]